MSGNIEGRASYRKSNFPSFPVLTGDISAAIGAVPSRAEADMCHTKEQAAVRKGCNYNLADVMECDLSVLG
jgi:hypothetical protein